MSGSMIEVMGVTPRMGRRSMALADIDPKYVSQSGIWEASEMETSRGSIRIQHLTSATSAAAVRPLSSGTASLSGLPTSSPRFPKLEECAHFHYDSVDLPALLKILIRDDPSKCVVGLNSGVGEDVGVSDRCAFSIEVVSGGQSWAIQRTHANLFMLDEQLHRCVWDRSFSLLEKVEKNSEDHESCKAFGERYFLRLTELPTNKITCGTVLSWLELDNRGRHIVSSDDSAINTPAVAAACAVRRYAAQAADEISFEVGDMISVIDMPPPEESVWWRGKRGFHVGFFPREHVQVIGDKVPVGFPIVSSARRLQRLSVTSNCSGAPAKPVLRKHGKLIAFFRSFILSRPSRRRLKQSGILRERVFSCDLAEHLLNTGNEIPAVLKCCSEFIEMYGIVDGIYRLSGITSNIQKLRNSFDEDKVPNLAEDEAIKQDIHAVSSLLKMYFRELPNPLCTYQLYEKFVGAAQASDEQRLFKMREVVHELPPPHYRTLEYLMKHLARVAKKSNDTGMTPKNMAIVWAPNLIRCKELEAGGVAALKGIGVQAVVTEYLVRHADLIFNEKLPDNFPSTTTLLTHKASGRPKSLAISSPIRLMSLEEAQDKAKDDRKYIEVGGGPSSLPPKYHTVIDLPSRRSALKNKRSPIGWRHFFSRNRSFSKPVRKAPTPCEITVVTKNLPLSMVGGGTNWVGRLRPVKSVESLVSSPLYQGPPSNSSSSANSNPKELLPDNHSCVLEEPQESKSSPVTPVANVHVVFHAPPPDCMMMDPRGLLNPKTHNRSISHDSYFEFGEFRNSNNVYIDETLEEETMSHSSKLSLELSSGIESNGTSPKKVSCFRSPVTPPPSAASLQPPEMMSESITSVTSMSSDEISDMDERILSRSPLLSGGRVRPSKWIESDSLTSPIQHILDMATSPTSPPTQHSTKYDLRDSSSVFHPVELRRSQVSMTSSDNSKYELDRNSSLDESSADSTPGEVFATTNIVYSPLVNEIPSSVSSSLEKLKTVGHPAMQIQTASLFICPLYEAGIKEIPPTRINTQPAKPPQYENFKPPEKNSILPPPPLSTNESQPHVYENNRVYQNEIFGGSKDLMSPEIMVLGSPESENANSGDLLEDNESNHLSYGEHYEHVNSREESESGDYEGNIYEDIDDDNSNDKNSYETVTVCHPKSPSRPSMGGSSSNNVLLNSSDNSDTETAYESVQFQVNHHYAEIHDPTSCNENKINSTESNVNVIGEEINSTEDKVNSTENETNSIVLLKTESFTPPSESSSPSHSHTEDVVTYLDITPSLKLREDSLEDQSQIKPDIISNKLSGGSSSRQTSEEDEEEEEEIRHIDSPGLVDNPLYGIQLGEEEVEETKNVSESDDRGAEDVPSDNENEFSINESISIELDDNSESKKLLGRGSGDESSHKCEKLLGRGSGDESSREKLLGRCNSAPLSDTMCEFAIASRGNGENGDEMPSGGGAEGGEKKKLILCKRLSEPSLLFSNQTANKNEAAAAWKIADAKRLANRKQSVKELLSRFEKTKEEEDCPPSAPVSMSPPAGLPRPDSSTRNHLQSGGGNRPLGGSARFQHHRFSMGDILMSSSHSHFDSSDDLSAIKSSTLLIRSDTFPELRTEASKENHTSPDSESQNLSDSGHTLVADKVQQALRVAMSSVDMNDPSTRERIEKYKEERRMFLRQKISSEMSDVASKEVGGSKGSLSSLKSPDVGSVSSTESVFGSTGNGKLLTPPSSSSLRSSESPRKRAFSEDIPPLYTNQTKTIKTESVLKSSVSKNSNETISSGAESMEEVNVREKVALWSVQKASMSQSTSGESISSKKDDLPPKQKVPLKEATSLPPEGFNKSVLRRQVPASPLEISSSSSKIKSASTPAARTDSGKKIKDMAAFFERKQF